jgi:hypothetical protein
VLPAVPPMLDTPSYLSSTLACGVLLEVCQHLKNKINKKAISTTTR